MSDILYYSPAMLAFFDIFDEGEQEEIRRAEVSDALGALEPLEREVITLRYGLGPDNNTPRSLRDVAAIMQCSHERIRVVESKALSKLSSIPGPKRPY